MHGGTGQGKHQKEAEARRLAERYIPPNILADFERAVNDPGLFDLTAQMALLEARVDELKRGMAEHRALPDAWEKALKLWEDASNQDSKTRDDSMEMLGALLQEGVADWRAWKEIRETIDLQVRCQRGQINKMEKLDQFITKQQATALGGALMSIMRRYIQDPVARERALTEIAMQFQKAPLLPTTRAQ